MGTSLMRLNKRKFNCSVSERLRENHIGKVRNYIVSNTDC